MENRVRNVALLCAVLLTCFLVGMATAAESQLKIGFVSIQEIILQSKAGQGAQKAFQAEASKYESELKKDSEELKAMEEEIKKKSSVWSEEVRDEKRREFEKRVREFRIRESDAKDELQRLQQRTVGPILKDVGDIIGEIGKQQGFTMIFETGPQANNGLLFTDDALNINDMVIKELDARRPQ